MKPKFSFYISIFLIVIFLSSCERKSGRRGNNEVPKSRYEKGSNFASSTNIVKMRNQNGVYYVPIKINGVDMEFIFDTGASIISISVTEAMFLYKQGKLFDEDFIGVTHFSDATGSISEGTLINLREVNIGNKVLYNIKASIVHNLDAPLLLGQSALNKFGKISIDYSKNTIILE